MMIDTLRQDIRQAYRRDEAECISALMLEFQAIPYDREAVSCQARKFVAAVRQQRRQASGVDHLMHEFSLSSHEGIALMCLAEALLRIPDRDTVDRLIRDKISHGDWASHLGSSPSLFINAATWGLMLTGKLVAIHSESTLGSALSRVLAKGGEPLIRKGIDFAMRLLGQQFVMGETIEAALKRAEINETKGYGHSFDMLGEAALTEADAQRYFRAYEQAIHAIGRAGAGRGVFAGPGISLKLSALHPRYVRSQRKRVMSELLPRLKQLLLLAKQYDIGLNIDAEEADRLELSLDLLEEVAADPDLAGWHGLGFVVQAYQKRCPSVINALIAQARRTQRRLMIRLVKGAYWDSEIKRTQVDGLSDYPVYTRKEHSDLAYLVCASRLLAAPDAVYPQFATHNAHTLASVFQMAKARGIDDYEFQCLHGMGEPLYDNLVGISNLDKRCRIYAPVGSHETLLPYLVRRLLENGANSSFVNRIVDETVSVDELIENPCATVRRLGGQRHPAIPLPRDLYGHSRLNSAGVDLSDETTISALTHALGELGKQQWLTLPLVAGLGNITGSAQTVRNPANRSEQVGSVIEADAAMVDLALANALAASASWHETPLTERSAVLIRAADLLEAHRFQIISLCLREAGKTWSNAVAELREAVDFCRYYGQQLINGEFQNPALPPGPVICISPWNFPLAIFIGQLSGALAAGSPVLAKPAEQTPLIAHFAIQLLHQAGVPRAVLQFLPGRGETVGARLTADPRVRGVVFTGSSEVARLINQSIAQREGVRLIAETGGQNVMIVDSSALPEQVVQDVLISGFDSAGQRCSALRVLCLQNDIADHTLNMLKAAMRELVIGDPLCLATDIGPVIDEEARSSLLTHIEYMAGQGRPVYQLVLPESCHKGCYVAPTIIEINSLADLNREVFGPVVHVLRFAAEQLPTLIGKINATGYGLTLGIHSRIDETINYVSTAAQVGNIYVNRNMVGAVVGVQPFGGQGLSGTGPKAGGPLYLHCLAGNVALPSALINHPSVMPPDLRRLAEWALCNGRQALAERCDQYSANSLLGLHIPLPGPTGEFNSLHFVARGRMLCMAWDVEQLLHQLAAVFATGNQAAAVDSPVAQKILSLLGSAFAGQIELRAAGDLSRLAGVLHAGAEAPALRQSLAATEGPLLPIYRVAEDNSCYPLFRMLSERVISVNTTAAGGNTTLMTLGT